MNGPVIMVAPQALWLTAVHLAMCAVTFAVLLLDVLNRLLHLAVSGTHAMKSKQVLVLVLGITAVTLGYVVARVPATRNKAQYGGFEPHRVVQRHEKVYDDGRVEPELDLEIFTATDGSFREIRTTLNSDGSAGAVSVQLVSPSLGVFLIYPQTNTYLKLRGPQGSIRHLTSEEVTSLEGFDHIEALPNGFVGYVRKLKTDGKEVQIIDCPDLGAVLGGLTERPAGASYRTVRRTISIGPSKDADAALDLTKYRQLPGPALDTPH